MIRNYLLIALRNLQRNSAYAVINIAGLSVGFASGFLILLWVADEMSFDRFHEGYDHLYQVHINHDIAGKIETSAVGSYPLFEALKNRPSQIKHTAITNHGEGYLLAAGENKVSKMGLVATDDFLKMFSFKMISGNPATVLTDPTSIVLSASTARALFGNEEALNKIVRIENEAELKVAGIIEDVPAQSSFRFDFLLPFHYYETNYRWVSQARVDWRRNSFRLYVELQPGAGVADVNNAIGSLVKENDPRSPGATVFLHGMPQWRLYSEFTNGMVSGGKIESVRMFTAIGVFILIIACINFMNLATARSQYRAREVGIRKSVGSRRYQLIAQFLGESFLITVLAFVFAIVLVEVTLPFYNTLVSKTLAIDYANPLLWLCFLGIIFVTGLLAGSYPAFYLSAFKPVKVLKGAVDQGRGSVTPRKVLVIFQFAFSIFLVTGAIVVYQQTMHVKERYTGYDRENLMLIWTTPEVEKSFTSLREDLERSGVVKSVCKSSAPITRVFSSTDDVAWPGKVGDEKVLFTTMATEYDFAKTMGISVLEGRDFSPEFKSDTSSVLVSKAALALMDLEHPIGSKIKMWDAEWTIVGVLDDVIIDSPYQPVVPLIMIFSPGWSTTVSVRLEKTQDVATAVGKVEKVFKTFDPEHPLWYRFADEEFATKFAGIDLIGRLAWIFTLLAILISSMGLFGLAAFTAEQRTKELGIRKVLGASVSSLVMLISRDFSKLVVLAFIFSSPIAWWSLSTFLEEYPYRIGIAWWVFPLAGAGALILAVIIVSTQALKAATYNPVDSLRSE